MINFFSGFVVPESAKNLKDMFGARREIEKKFGADIDASKNAMLKWKAAHPTIPGHISIVVDHIDHVAETAGIDHVCLDGDFDGVEVLPKGLGDVAKYQAITELLLRKGYSEADIHKIMSGNMMRILKACEAAKG